MRNTLAESKSPLLNAFINEFGEDLVFSTENNLKITPEICQRIYAILDKTFFNNKLQKNQSIILYVGNADQLNKIIQNEYVHNSVFDVSDFLALCQPDAEYKILTYNNRQFLKVLIHKIGIFINLDKNSKVNLVYAIMTICHEMIHALDLLEGTLTQQTEALINKGATSDVISYASHFTPLFKKMLANMKKQNGLTIRIEGENLSIDELCNLAMKEAMLLKEATINIEFSKLPTAVFSKKFQKKYKDCIAFDEDGHGHGFSFGQK